MPAAPPPPSRPPPAPPPAARPPAAPGGHQAALGYDGRVLEVHFFSRRKFLRTTETIAVVEDATSDDVLDELERRVNDADFVLPEALVQWRAPATRKGLVPAPLDALPPCGEVLSAEGGRTSAAIEKS